MQQCYARLGYSPGVCGYTVHVYVWNGRLGVHAVEAAILASWVSPLLNLLHADDAKLNVEAPSSEGQKARYQMPSWEALSI